MSELPLIAPLITKAQLWSGHTVANAKELAKLLGQPIFIPRPWPRPGDIEYLYYTFPGTGYRISTSSEGERRSHLILVGLTNSVAPRHGVDGWIGPVKNDPVTYFNLAQTKGHVFVKKGDFYLHLMGAGAMAKSLQIVGTLGTIIP